MILLAHCAAKASKIRSNVKIFSLERSINRLNHRHMGETLVVCIRLLINYCILGDQEAFTAFPEQQKYQVTEPTPLLVV